MEALNTISVHNKAIVQLTEENIQLKKALAKANHPSTVAKKVAKKATTVKKKETK